MADLKSNPDVSGAPGADGTGTARSGSRPWLPPAAGSTATRAGINALNVFPVPDGDTGTNMTLTMQAADKQWPTRPAMSVSRDHGGHVARRADGRARQLGRHPLAGACAASTGASKGSERSARAEWAAAMREAAGTAYQAVLKPVEGTMLTVIREMAEGAEAAAATRRDLLRRAERDGGGRARLGGAHARTAPKAARRRAWWTPGGQGLFVIFEGMLRYRARRVGRRATAASGGGRRTGAGRRACRARRVWLLHQLHPGGQGSRLSRRCATGSPRKGDSAVVVGDDRLIKVHVHTEQPGEILNYVTALRQLAPGGDHRYAGAARRVPRHARARATAARPRPPPRSARHRRAVSGIATLAVVAGAGLAEAFRSMGATALVEGGQTMNPSTEEMLRAIEALPQREVIILPNNGNIIMAAKQTQSLTRKRVAVVPTDTHPAGHGRAGRLQLRRRYRDQRPRHGAGRRSRSRPAKSRPPCAT